MNRTVVFVTAATVALGVSQLVSPVGANAIGPAPRYASPGASDTATCASTDPCSITTAINGATFSGVTIHLAAGSYGSKASPITVELETPDGANVIGAPGGASVVYSAPTASGGGIFLPDGGSISNVTLISNTQGATGLEVDNGTATHVAVYDTDSADQAFGACASYGGSFVDSLCVESGTSPLNSAFFETSSVAYSATLTNDTLVDTAPGGYGIAVGDGGALGQVTATNTIAVGQRADIYTYAQPGATAKVSVSHCDYVTTKAAKLGGTETVVQTGPNVLKAPQFVAAGNYRESEHSRTIDAGVIESGTDLAGKPRTFGPATDIGAYEFQGAKPAMGALKVVHRTRHKIVVTATINGEDLATTARAIATHHGKHVKSVIMSFSASHKSQNPLFTLKNLKRHTSYSIVIIAKNADGTKKSRPKTVATKH